MGLLTKAGIGALTGGLGLGAGAGGWHAAGKGALAGAAGVNQKSSTTDPNQASNPYFHILNALLSGDDSTLEGLIQSAVGGRRKKFDPNRPMDDNPRF